MLNNSSATDAVGRNPVYVPHRGIFTEANLLQCEEYWKAHVVHCVGGEERFPCLQHSFYKAGGSQLLSVDPVAWVSLFRDRGDCFSVRGGMWMTVDCNHSNWIVLLLRGRRALLSA